MRFFLRTLAITICAAMSFANAQAQVITADRAQEIANSFFSSGMKKSPAARSTAVSLNKSADSHILTNTGSSEAPTFHILTPASGEGFVIVSGEEIENPIIGYSFEGTIDTNNLPVGFVDYIADIDAQVKALRKYNAENPQKAAAARSAMQKTNYNATAMGNQVYLETASWGQDYPFNAQCFTSYNGSTNALTGCVPTAYAIIMRYHEWPQVGTGTLYNCQAPTYVEITDRTYDYSKMPLVYDGNWSTEQINEVAKLMSHLGHSFMVSYGSSQTSVSDPSNTDKPNKYFNYNLVYASYQANFTMDSWEEKIKESIDNGCPIPYASDNAGTGDTRHMFVLDGYTANDYFHFNFGWKGNGNGWFKLDAITPSQGDNYSWQSGADHYAIFNFTPNKTKYAVNASVSPENAGTVSINGSAAASSATGEYIEGLSVTLAATANTGYTFSNWTKGGGVVSTNKSCTVKVASSNNDYVANFLTVGNTTVNVSVTYNSSYGTVTGTSGTVANGTTLTPRLNEEVTLTATPLDGYVFNGWTVTKGTESTNYSGTSLTFVATGEMSVQANFALAETDYIIDNTTGTTLTTSRVNYWEHNAIKLTLSTDDGGIAYNGYISLFAGASGSETYTLTAPTGYTITKYKFSQCRSQSTSSTYNLSIVADAEYPLTTSEQDITISNVNAATAQFTVKGDAGRSMYTKQIIVTLKKDGAGGGSTPPPTQYTITATANPGTAGSVTGGGTYNEGATVTLTATPNSGYEFVNWTKGGIEVSTNATYSFTANATAEYVAHFQTAAATTFAVTTTANPAAGGTATFAVGTGQATTSATVASGTGVTLYAVANDGYRFVNWTKGGMEVSTNATPNVTITEASDYVANFEAEEPELPITGKKLDVTFNGATGFPNSGNTNQVQTATAPVITISSDENNIGFSTIDGVKHPYLFKNCSFTISVPEPYRIAGYKLTVQGHNFNAGTFTYTVGEQLARSNTATATIEGETPKTVIATGLNNSEININVGNATAATAGIIITALEIDYVEEAQAGTFPDGAYKIFWQQDGRGYLAYHTGYPNEAKLADVTYPECQNKHFASTSPEVDLVWYLITAQDGNRYLFHAATGKFLAANADISPTNTSKANKLSTTEALSIRIEKNTAHSGHYVIKATVNSTDALLSSGCGTSSETGNPVRWWYDNDNVGFMSDGGSPLQFVSTTADVSDAIMNQVRLVIDGVDITANAGEGGSVTINGEATGTKRVIKGSSVTLNATPASGYSFLNWSNAEGIVSETAEYTFTANSATTLTANFETVKDGLTTGYYHLVSRATSSHEYLYNNALRTNNSKEFTLQSDSKITTNNGIWYITVNNNQLGVKNGDGNALVTGAAFCGDATSHNTLNIEKTTDVDGVIYYSFVEGINCTNRTQYNFTLEGGNSVKDTDNNYVTTWTGHPDEYANQWRFERVDTEGKNIYDVVVECTENDVYVTYGSEYAFDGGFFITNETITAQQLTAKKNNAAAQDVTISIEDYTIRVIDTESVDITVSTTPAEGGSVTINGEATGTKRVIKGSSVTLNATPASGYSFLNWSNAEGIVSETAEYTFTANGATTLTANFERITYTINVNANPIEGGTVTGGGIYNEGATVTLTATPNSGYEFVNWTSGTTTVSTSATYSFTANASAEYIANFRTAAPTTFAVTTTANPTEGGTATFAVGTGQATTSATVASGTGVTLYAVANDGYRFVNWTKGGMEVSTNATHDVTITEASDYVANFEKAPATGGGNDTDHNIVTNGTTGEASEADGSYYKVWTSSNSPKIILTSPAYTIAKNDNELRLRAATYTLSLDNSVDEDLKIVSYTINYEKNASSSSITLSAEGEEDQTPGETIELQSFVVDSFDPTRSTSFTVTTGQVSQTIWVKSIDITLRGPAQATGDYCISVIANAGGSATVAAAGGAGSSEVYIDEGTEVTLTATPESGYRFLNWSNAEGIVSNEAEYRFTPTESGEYFANFMRTYTINIGTNSAEAGSATVNESASSVTIDEGASITLVATENDGYEFMGWEKDGVRVAGVGITNQYTIYDITYDATFTAIFSKITDYTQLEDGVAYNIRGRMEDGSYIYVYCDGTNLKYSTNKGSSDSYKFVVQKTDDKKVNLISALGYYGWNQHGTLSNEYAEIEIANGIDMGSRTLYSEIGTNCYTFSTDGNENIEAIKGFAINKSVAGDITSDFDFVEVNDYKFNVSVADGSNAKLGTINLPFATKLPDGIKAYKAEVQDDDLVMTELELTDNILPANTPVLIEGTSSGKFGFAPAPASDETYDTGFSGTLDAKDIDSNVKAYILSYDGAGTEIKFYKLSSTSRKINANKAYFEDSTGSLTTAFRIRFAGVTGIDGIEKENEMHESVYDLQGRKLEKVTSPGIYIVDGKKKYIK